MTYYYNENKIIKMANHILEKQTTIRETAKAFNTPKSTVHHDLSVKLKYIDIILYREVKELLEHNFEIKHIHGGESTKLKYEKLKQEINKNDELDLNNSY